MGRFAAVRHREKGAAAVETALVLMLVIYLAMGMVETALVVLDKLAVGNASREGARVGAIAAVEPTADDLIIAVVEKALCSHDFGTANRILIYSALANGRVPGHLGEKAYTTSNPSLVNTFTPNGGTNACANGNIVPDFSKLSGTWNPPGRDALIPGGLDELGVLIVYSHDDVTGLLPVFEGTYSEFSVMRLQPDVTS